MVLMVRCGRSRPMMKRMSHICMYDFILKQRSLTLTFTNIRMTLHRDGSLGRKQPHAIAISHVEPLHVFFSVGGYKWVVYSEV